MKSNTSSPTPDSSMLTKSLTFAREAAGLDIPEAAKASGLSVTSLVAIESGTRPPEPQELERLARAYGRRNTDGLWNPGSPQAVAKGCVCPVLDNFSGWGRSDGMFIIVATCPLHGRTKDDDSHEG